MSEDNKTQHSLEDLVSIMARLRADDGCPWDREQTLSSLQPYLLEEAHEVLQAMDSGDSTAHREELGDLLLQILFQSQIAAEEGSFDMAEVVDGLAKKLIRRHPHVFADAKAETAEDVVQTWERIKKEERPEDKRSVLDGLPKSLPALLMAHKLGQRASRVGFDWPDLAGVEAKVKEEWTELEEARALPEGPKRKEELAWELGDLIFSLANLARHLDFDAENLLRKANERFEARFRKVEIFAQSKGLDMKKADIDSLEALWQQAKQELSKP